MSTPCARFPLAVLGRGASIAPGGKQGHALALALSSLLKLNFFFFTFAYSLHRFQPTSSRATMINRFLSGATAAAAAVNVVIATRADEGALVSSLQHAEY